MDDFENERTGQLIGEREEYETLFFDNVIDEMIESDSLDLLIEQRLDYLEKNFELENLDEITILESQYSNHEIMNPHDQEVYDSLIDKVFNTQEIEDEEHLKSLIDEHVSDEKRFMDSILIEVIQEQDMFEKAIDKMILEHFEMDYQPDIFDYEHEHWYDGPYDGIFWSDEDESVKDPFDSLGDIDYPEGYVEKGDDDFHYIEYDDEPIEFNDYDPLEEEAEKHYMKQTANPPRKQGIVEFKDPDELRNKKLIMERMKIESLFKDYFTKDDSLEELIKDKLKEKKFN